MYCAEINKIKGAHFDAAFIPLDPRQEEHYADGMLYFLKHVDCNAVFPMHYWNEPSMINRFITEYPQYKSRIKNTESAKGEEIWALEWFTKTIMFPIWIGRFHLAFKADNFDLAHKKHEEMGCICFENPEMGIYFIEDPDGYWLEILPWLSYTIIERVEKHNFSTLLCLCKQFI